MIATTKVTSVGNSRSKCGCHGLISVSEHARHGRPRLIRHGRAELLQHPLKGISCLVVKKGDAEDDSVIVLVHAADKTERPAETVGIKGSIHHQHLTVLLEIADVGYGGKHGSLETAHVAQLCDHDSEVDVVIKCVVTSS